MSTNPPKYIKYDLRKEIIFGKVCKCSNERGYTIIFIKFVKSTWLLVDCHGLVPMYWPNKGMTEITEEEYLVALVMDS